MADKGNKENKGNRGKNRSDLQSALDSLKSKGVHVLLVDGKIKLRGNVDRNIKPELRILNANRETLCLLLELESTSCEDTPDSDDKSKPDSEPESSPSLDLGITPGMSQAQIEAKIKQHNERMRQEREELAAKRRDKSLIEVSLGVFRSREEVEKENHTYIFELPNRRNGMRMIAARGQVNYHNQSLLESQLDRFRDWTESQWKERE